MVHVSSRLHRCPVATDRPNHVDISKHLYRHEPQAHCSSLSQPKGGGHRKERPQNNKKARPTLVNALLHALISETITKLGLPVRPFARDAIAARPLGRTVADSEEVLAVFAAITISPDLGLLCTGNRMGGFFIIKVRLWRAWRDPWGVVQRGELALRRPESTTSRPNMALGTWQLSHRGIECCRVANDRPWIRRQRKT